MKKLILLVCYLLLGGTGYPDASHAYYLDTPHNESNGIQCHFCHSNPAFGWSDPTNGTGDIDVTFPNTVCLQCHDEASVDPFKGPFKRLHASSTTSEDKGIWSTRCTDCHDPHFQGQLDYAASDPNKLFLANGKFTEAIPVFDPVDPDSPDYGASAINFDQLCNPTVCPGWDNVSLWAEKGGHMDPVRAEDNTRGLILVPNKSNPADNYEIIGVTDLGGDVYRIKVKGRMDNVVPGQQFGVIYGQNIKPVIRVPNTYSDRAVKFFQPDIVTGDHGGYTDNNPATETAGPRGLCQVCHTATIFWKTDGTLPHNETQSCGYCHIAANGFGPSSHSFNFFANSPDCGSCHIAHLTAPDSAHGSCSYCHQPSGIPAINSNVTLAAEGISVNTALITAGYYFDGTDGRLRDAGGNDIGAPGFQAITCATCHTVNGNTFYDHTANTHFRVIATIDGTCETCHVAVLSPFYLPAGFYDPPGVTVPPPGEVHSSIMCFHCHESGPTGVFIGSAVNHTIGIDSDCKTCHIDRVNGHVAEHNNIAYEDSPTNETNGAVSGNCDNCHASMGFPDTTSGHVGRLIAVGDIHGGANIGQTISCATCHGSNVPAVVNTIGNAKGSSPVNVPASCADCHGPRPDPHSGHNDSHFGWDGNCVTCHLGTNVVSDVHQDKCGVCHADPVAYDFSRITGANGDAALGSKTSACSVCHPSGTYPVKTIHHATSSAVSGNCTVCHPASDHTNMVQNYVNCLNCHVVVGNTVDPDDPKVHNGCVSCHNIDGSLIDPAASTLVTAMPAGGAAPNDGGGTCYNCHNAYFSNHTNIDHLTPVWVAPLPFCTTYCHTNTAGTTTTVPVSGTDTKLHDYCTNCHNSNGTLKNFSQADINNPDRIIAMAPGDCSSCHDANYFESHLRGVATPPQYRSHAMEDPTGTNLTLTQNCLSANCHIATDGRGPYTDLGQVHEPRKCDTCHDLSGPNLDAQLKAGPYGDATVNSYGIDINGYWECGECHYNHFDGHADRNANTGTFAHDVLMRGTDLAGGLPCTDCHKRGGTTSGNPEFINEWAGTDGINGLHNGCDTCHTSGRLEDTSGGGVQYVIQNGAVVGCLDCHASRNSYHIDHLLDDQDSDLVMAIEESPQCTSCHTGGGLTGSLTETNMVAIHGGSCGTCHQNSAGSGALHDYSGTGGNINDNVDYETLNSGHGGTCVTCHVRYGSNFETSHQVVDHRDPALAASLVPYVAETGTPTCTFNCHGGGSSLDTILVDEHGDGLISTCTNCHTDMISDGSLRLGLNNNGDARNHALGTSSDCSTCHSLTIYPWGHDSGDTGFNHIGKINLTGDGTCENCHTPADLGNGVEYELFWTIHYSQICGGCHNISDGMILKAGWDGLGTAEFGPGNCKHCHSAPNGPMVNEHPAAHDNAPYEDPATKETNPAIIGVCSACHDAEGFADISTGHVGRVVTTGALGTPVASTIDCWTCHNISTGAIGQAISWGRVGGSGSEASCADCHGARPTPHP